MNEPDRVREETAMEELQDIDVKAIMERIRENLRRREAHRAESSVSPAPVSRANGPLATDLDALHAGYDLLGVEFTSHRKILGAAIVSAKRILRKLLTPVFERQVAYNASNTRVVTHLKEWLEELDREAQESQDREKSRAGRLEAAEAALRRFEVALDERAQLIESLREQLARTEGRLGRLVHLLTSEEGGADRAGTSERVVPRAALEPEFDTLGFGERFWGSESEVRERRRVYVDFFRGRDEVLDIGCGRGEFLELLREAGIGARGVDLDLDMTLLCRAKALAVTREDAFTHLESLPDGSLGGIFGAQVVEHVEPARVIELVKLAHRKLRPGGILILETPNPSCLMVFAQSFYMDFTHTRPIHPRALQFLLESSGFQDVALKFSAPVDSSIRLPLLKDPAVLGEDGVQLNRSVTCLNDLLFGYQDYAVIGRKP